jgi:hypothetical protein
MIPHVWTILTREIGGRESYRDCLIGIGFDRKLGSSKIVLCGKLRRSEKITSALIYNAKNDRWRKVSDINDVFLSSMNDPFVFGELLCWVVKSKRQGKQMVMFFLAWKRSPLNYLFGFTKEKKNFKIVIIL